MLDPEELLLSIQISEDYDEEKDEFVEERIEIRLKHSLASLSKWEMIWGVSLIGTEDKTLEQQYSYLECMCLTPNVAPEVFRNITDEQQIQIRDYIEGKHSATWFSKEPPKPRNNETITSELIYYWMSAFRIDWEAQYWHLNRLITLIKIFSVKADNMPQKQSSRGRRQEMMNEIMRRRKELGSNG